MWMSDADNISQQLVNIVARARVEGWYEDDPGWGEADGLLRQLGYDVPA